MVSVRTAMPRTVGIKYTHHSSPDTSILCSPLSETLQNSYRVISNPNWCQNLNCPLASDVALHIFYHRHTDLGLCLGLLLGISTQKTFVTLPHPGVGPGNAQQLCMRSLDRRNRPAVLFSKDTALRPMQPRRN